MHPRPNLEFDPQRSESAFLARLRRMGCGNGNP